MPPVEKILPEHIVGAKVTAIHLTSVDDDEFSYIAVYFTVDRGLTFQLPCPGQEWFVSVIPEGAEELPDETSVPVFQVKRGWFGKVRVLEEPPQKIEVVRKIKERTIAGVFCHRVDDDDIYMPDDAFLLFDDGSRAFCVSSAPEGIAGGLFHRPKDPNEKTADLISIFDVPLER